MSRPLSIQLTKRVYCRVKSYDTKIIPKPSRIMDFDSEYGKRMMRLSNKIFGEVARPTDEKSMRVVTEIMSNEPWEQQEIYSVQYYPNLPMFHYLTKMLKMHGIYYDEHVVWREVQNEIRLAKGKVVFPKIGEGKQKAKREKTASV
ncbi:hypothetical protein Mgra_00008032 [Meloidogyne graminicola]|uniref:Small ribosomal subunit protein mS33 n=1 Tax=Meloidogyne graminicola TaxID=189291 RepID=A0A8S9ZH22_9BILA|nr:hypothetical protein Mgra_00008032 [Meloidogyne graminicola]